MSVPRWYIFCFYTNEVIWSSPPEQQQVGWYACVQALSVDHAYSRLSELGLPENTCLDGEPEETDECVDEDNCLPLDPLELLSAAL